jgi:CRP/FNR family transcriptional regulator
MELSAYLPFWSKLEPRHQALLQDAVTECHFEKGRLIHNGSADCVGLYFVIRGRLRVFVMSEEGKELTLYWLLDRDICLLSASCLMRSIQFDVIITTEEDTDALHIPVEVYRRLMEESVVVANYTNELIAANFSEVMWRMDQVMNKKLDSRLAAFLLEEAGLRESSGLPMTHEQIANHLGSAREVVTRMMKYFQTEGLVRLGRGSIELLDMEGLRQLAAESMR